MEEKIKEILEEVNEEILSYTGKNMVADGLVDSFELISIITELEDAFDIEIGAEHIVEENLGNIKNIVSFVERMTKK